MDEPHKTRKTLIQRVVEDHDEQSWNELVGIYRPYIYAILIDMKIPRQDAEEILQQVLIRLWKYFESYSPEKRFRHWLSRITRNCARDHFRDTMQRAERLEEVAQDVRLSYLKPIRQADVDRIAEREWELHLAGLALSRIKDQFSGRAIKVFVMSLQGVPVQEIARQLELKENSVYRLKNRVKKQLIMEIKVLREELE